MIFTMKVFFPALLTTKVFFCFFHSWTFHRYFYSFSVLFSSSIVTFVICIPIYWCIFSAIFEVLWSSNRYVLLIFPSSYCKLPALAVLPLKRRLLSFVATTCVRCLCVWRWMCLCGDKRTMTKECRLTCFSLCTLVGTFVCAFVCMCAGVCVGAREGNSKQKHLRLTCSLLHM